MIIYIIHGYTPENFPNYIIWEYIIYDSMVYFYPSWMWNCRKPTYAKHYVIKFFSLCVSLMIE